MDFREREVNFEEADRRYAELRRQRDAGSISDEEFDAQRRQLMVQDDEGRWWAKSCKTGEWHYRDGSTWVRGIPPDYQEGKPEPTGSAGQSEHRPAGRSARRIRVIAGLAILFASLAIAAITVSLTSIDSGGGSNPRAEGVAVPSLNGQTVNAAELSAGEDFEINISERRISNEPKDTILSQDPEPSEMAQRGSSISVVVSTDQDDFSSPSSGWPREEFEDGGVTDYTSDGYRIHNRSVRTREALINDVDIKDASVEVDATRIGDAPSSELSNWGVICRAQDNVTYYAMGIAYNGVALIGKTKGEEATVLTYGEAGDAIREDPENNHIRGDCVQSRLTLYVNDQKLLEVEDAEFASGSVGLYVANAEADPPGTDVTFDNFLVDKP